MKSADRRNHYAFGLGTIGRDMLYSMVSMYLLFYLTDILNLPESMLWWVNGIMLAFRIFDAVNDPVMGILVDNTHSRHGKFKPWIAFGAVGASVVAALLFTDFGLRGAPYLIVFTLLHLLWDVFFTANDIAYWSMLPSLSVDQKQREKIGAFARICANIGLFGIVVGIVPITNALGAWLGSPEAPNMPGAFNLLAVILGVIMCLGQCITLFGVKEQPGVFQKESTTTLKGMFVAIFKNDQLLYTAVSMALFMIGYTTTTSFGLYFFKYIYGDEGMYSMFALILGVSQIVALLVFPLFSKRFNRKQLYTGATLLLLAGYVLFFFAPMDMRYIGPAGMMLFIGQAFIQLLMLMFLADTIEYGQWKLGKRNDSVTFSLQPFINKIGGAVSNGVVGVTVIISGMVDAKSHLDMTPQGILTTKISMMALPLICIVAGYIIYLYKYKIDEKAYANILADLQARGDLKLEE